MIEEPLVNFDSKLWQMMKKTPKPHKVILFGKIILFGMISILILLVFLIYKTVVVFFF